MNYVHLDINVMLNQLLAHVILDRILRWEKSLAANAHQVTTVQLVVVLVAIILKYVQWVSSVLLASLNQKTVQSIHMVVH